MNDTITFNKEAAMKILTALEHSIPSKDHTKEERSKIYDYMYDLIYKIAEHYGLDIENGYVDPLTLEFKNFEPTQEVNN